jgi:hypothetical protein
MALRKRIIEVTGSTLPRQGQDDGAGATDEGPDQALD